MTRPIESVIYLGENQLNSGVPLYLQGELVERIYLGELVVYRITVPKAKK
jgi:hypothetical protein